MRLKFMSAILLAITCAISARAQADMTVHEWGTFTSVQGGDGQLIPWRPLKTSELPNFVYNWSKPGRDRFSTGVLVGKGDMVTLQRLETPVIYFYSTQALTVNVDVRFPKGLITEWYPQATQIGPALSLNTNVAASSAALAATSTTFSESRAAWKNLAISPEQLIEHPRLITDTNSSSHYFAARETHADLVEPFAIPDNEQVEMEKFIFYRGAGSFETPLKVTVDTNNVVSVENKGAEKLSHLFLVTIHAGIGAFAEIDTLSPSNAVSWYNLNTVSWHNFNLAPGDWGAFPLPELQHNIASRMESALKAEGLFAAEAHAMVQTWMDSWFTEEGERVLYILPRSWTDETLPLTITPRPTNLVRVMVGRAEIITPRTQHALANALSRAAKGDAIARSDAIDQLKRLGRFAEPALNLANVHGGDPDSPGNYGYEFLPEVSKSLQK